MDTNSAVKGEGTRRILAVSSSFGPRFPKDEPMDGSTPGGGEWEVQRIGDDEWHLVSMIVVHNN